MDRLKVNITASVNYHITSLAPQAFRFDVDGMIGNLISPELVAKNVSVTDLRGQTDKVNFDDDGLVFLTAPSTVEHFDVEGHWQFQYEQEVSALLKLSLGAQEVKVFDHTLRIDDTDSPRQPARNVHNDFSSEGANQRLVDLVGTEKAQDYQQGRFAFVNVWRPVASVITSSPLGFIRPRSMLAEDWMNIELIYPDRLGQILGVAENPHHEWFYFSNMTPDEVIVFNIYDNHDRPYLAHSALDIVGQVAPPVPRKSIETRTLVRYL